MKPREDGVRVVRKSGQNIRLGWILAVLAAIAVGFWVWVSPGPHYPDATMRTPLVGPHTASIAAQRGDQEVNRKSAFHVRVRPSKVPAAAQAESPHKAGEEGAVELMPSSAATPAIAPEGSDSDVPSGIALYPPPGTNPPKSGLIVPDDFELPPGYVRHYQVTDDGKPLPPILMFHPDVELVDPDGNPIPLPPDLVVPPELAPPGFPLQVLQIPDTAVPWIEPPAANADLPAASNK